MKNAPAQATPLNSARIYQVKVTLKGSKPPIWRRLQVRGDTSLGELHDLLQIAMGWEDEHLHIFTIGGTTYGDPDSAEAEYDEFDVLLDEVAEEGDTLSYEYDFGDGWVHELKIEKVLDPEPSASYPRCLAGDRACPPEDSGGIPGYQHKLAVLTDPGHEDYAYIRDWLGEAFDPEAFDMAAVNDELKAYAADPMVHNVERPLPFYDDAELARLDEAALIECLRRDGDRVPRNLIDACAARGDTMIQALRQLLDSPQIQASTDEGDWWMTLHAAMVAGLIPTDAAGALLVELLRRIETEDDDMPDWLAGYWPALFANKPLTVVVPLRALVESADSGTFCTSQAADAVVRLACRESEEQREAALDWIAGLAGDERRELDDRLGFCFTLLDYPRDRHRPLLEKMARLQRGWGKDFDMKNIEQAFAQGRDDPEWERFTDPWKFYEPEEIETRQRRWAEEGAALDEPFADEFGAYYGRPDFYDLPEPYIRPEPKIGRNDPCPCGSGKKYKKCCLGKEQG